jgi:thiol-disulfide isomerase/thioredoxin
MTPGRIVLMVALALISAAGGYLAFNAMRDPPAADTPVATALPEFTLTDLDGVSRPSSEWDGQPRIINFWATWCPPCRREIPLLVELQASHRDSLQVIGIAVDDMDAVRDYAADTGFNYPIVVGQQDAVDLGNQILPDWIGLPFTAFVDRSGRITRVHVGELHREEAEEFIGEIL